MLKQLLPLLWVVFTSWQLDAQGTVGPPFLVGLQWTDALNGMGKGYNIYRAPVACATATDGQFFVIATAGQGNVVNPGTPTIFGFTDSLTAAGTYCYRVTATQFGVPESSPSNRAEGTVGSNTPPPPPPPPSSPLFAPTNLTVTIK